MLLGPSPVLRQTESSERVVQYSRFLGFAMVRQVLVNSMLTISSLLHCNLIGCTQPGQTWGGVWKKQKLWSSWHTPKLYPLIVSTGWIHCAHRATCSFWYVPWFPLGPSWSGASARHTSNSTQNTMGNGQAWTSIDGLKPSKRQCSVSCVAFSLWKPLPCNRSKGTQYSYYIYYSHNKSAKNMAPMQCAGDRGSKGPARTLPSVPGWATKVHRVCSKEILETWNTQKMLF